MAAQQPPAGALGFSNGTGNGFNGAQRPTNSNFVNPSADVNRKIGMPNGGHIRDYRGAYKPHAGVKRPAMADVTNTHLPQTDGASDTKKPRTETHAGEFGQAHDNSVTTG
jgi:DNA repair and recombination protein RAD52